jgi:hypothetical protein
MRPLPNTLEGRSNFTTKDFRYLSGKKDDSIVQKRYMQVLRDKHGSQLAALVF